MSKLQHAESFGVECSEIAYSYDGHQALREISIQAPSGSVTGLIGPNGAGKTTLIRILTTILRLQQGTFSVAGFGPTRPNEIRRRIGVLPESGGYPRRMTGHAFLTYVARLYGASKLDASDRAAKLLEEVGLTDRSHDRIKAYSRGMRQRLGLARALVNEPSVLFLDEPTLGLDPAGQQEVVSIIQQATSRRGATVFLTSHLLDEVEKISDQVVVLDRGRIVGQGTVGEITQARPGSLREVFLRMTKDE